VAYRAEIEIGVKGASQLKQLQERIKDLAFRAEALQVITDNLYSSKAVQSVRNYAGALNEAKSALDAVEIATKDEANAVREYVTALGEANEASARQNKLIEEEITLRNKARQGLQTQRRREEYLAGPGRTAPTEKLAQRSIKQAAEREARFEARKTFAEEIFNIEKNFDKKLRDTAIDNLLERFQLEENLHKRSFDRLLEAGKAEGEDFDKRLAQQTTDRLSANKKVNSARVRQRAAVYRLEQRRLKQITRERLKAEEAVSRKRKDALGSAIIGGAFPLLFGQGIGAAVGGGAGGAAGGLIGGQFGFGLSLVGTALGTAVDTTISNISKLANSLGDPTAALEALQQAGVKVDESTRLQIKTLVDAGNAYDAQSLILQEINDTLGPDAVAQLMAYKDESDKLQESFEEVSTEITMALVPALTGLLKVINGIVAITNSPQFKQALRDTARSQAIGFAVSNPMAALFSATGLGSIRLLNELGSRALPKGRPELSPEQKQIEQRRQASDKAENISLGILQQRNGIAGRYGDLLDEQVFKTRKTLIEEKALQDIQNLIAAGQFTANKRKAIQIKTSTALKELEASRNQQQDRANKKAEQASERALKAGARAAKQAARLAERDRQRLERSEKAGESLIRRLNQEIAIKRASTPLDKELLQIKNETETVQIRIGELLNKQQQDKANELLQEKELLALTEARADASLKAAGLDASTLGRVDFFSRDQKGVPSFESGFGLDVLGRQDEVLQKFLDKYKQVGEVAQLTSELVTFGIRDMVAGTKTAEQVFADFLRNIADMLLKTAATMIAQYIALGIARAFATGQSPASYVKGVDLDANFFKYVPRLDFGGGMEAMSARANGGPVSTGTPYIVGERGPELFVPNNSGNIVPNHALGGDVNVVVNVTETQTDTRGNGARANQVGNALAAAVQAEIIRQKRPGGLLAN
jgi:hypothetical protein